YRELEEARFRLPQDEVPSATTDAGGRFRLLGAPAGMVRLWGFAPGGLASYSPPVEVRAGQGAAGGELVLASLAQENGLRGIVLDPSGAPVPGARLEFRHTLNGGNVRGGEGQADAEGRFEFLLPADARTSLTASDPGGRFGPAVLADLVNGAREVVVQLHDARRVALVVESRGAAWLGPYALELLSADRQTRVGGLERAEHPEGRCVFVLPDESFVVRVLAPGHRVGELGPLDPGRIGGALRCALEPVPGLEGIVYSAGAPAAGVRGKPQAAVPPGLGPRAWVA